MFLTGSNPVSIRIFIEFFLLVGFIFALYFYLVKARFDYRRMQELRDVAEKYKTLVNAVSDGVFQCEWSGRFTLINQAGAFILGAASPQVLLTGEENVLVSLLGETVLVQLREELKQVGTIANRHLTVFRLDGIQIVVEVTLHLRSDPHSGRSQSLEGIFRDVTDRVASEIREKNYSRTMEKRVKERTTQLLAMEKNKLQLEKLASMGQMAAMIVHEIRNPLSSVKIGLTSIIKRPYLDDRDLKTLHLAVAEVDKLEKTLQDILHFSRPEELHRAWHQLNDVVGLVADQMEKHLEEAHVALRLTLDAGLPVLLIDTDRIGQVLINIILNAVNAMRPEGCLEIRTFHLPAEERVCLQIEDNGRGMDEGQLKKVFDPFYTTRHEGTGLGMTLVKKILTAHGGDIEIKSQVGEGTRVSVFFPEYESFSP